MGERKKQAATIIASLALSAFVTASFAVLAKSQIPVLVLALVFAVLFIIFFSAMQFLYTAHSLAGRFFFSKEGQLGRKKKNYSLRQSKKAE